MTLKHPRPYHGHASEYQVSGIPWVTSSIAPGNASPPMVIKFPTVTQFITVTSFGAGHDLHVGFTKNGVEAPESANYYVVENSLGSECFQVRCKEIWVRSADGGAQSFSVLAGLTNCTDFLVLTGSGGPHGDWDGVG